MSTYYKVPFFEALKKGPLQPGSSIVIEGFVLVSPQSFNVELICGKDKEKDDIAAVFEFIFKNENGENVTICRSRDKGQIVEPIILMEKFPFAPGKTFHMKICDLEDKLIIYVDHKKFIDFPRRTYLRRISHIHIDGSIELSSVKFH